MGKVGPHYFFLRGDSSKLLRLQGFSNSWDFFLKENILLQKNLGILKYKAEFLLIIVEPGLLILCKEVLSSVFQCIVNLVYD